jgi:hypothetical protein
MTLEQFLSNKCPFRSAWIKYPNCDVYLRKSRRYLPPSAMFPSPCIDVANITCRRQKQGTFTALVAAIQTTTHLPVYLENTHADFAASLLRHKWLNITSPDMARLDTYCLYLPYTAEGDN